MLVAWDTTDGDEILTSLNYPWDRCDPVWLSGKVLDRHREARGTILQQSWCFHYLNSVCLLASASS